MSASCRVRPRSRRPGRILAAAEDAAAKGVGAFVVDGQMIDEPFLVSARAIVALAEQFDPARAGDGR